MSKSRSIKGFRTWGIFVVLILALITTVTVSIIATNFSSDTVLIIFGSLSGVIFVTILFVIFYRMYKARPDLFYKDPEGNIRLKTPHDRFEYEQKESESPYDSVSSDSYPYTSRGRGKKPFTDFTLNETTKCNICKLEIAKNEKIYRCPKCRSPFHINHLSEWLNENSDCPVCNVELSI